MPLFLYHAKTAQGEPVSGELEAKNETDLTHELKKQNLFLIAALPKGFQEAQLPLRGVFSFQFLSRFQGVSLSERTMFSRNLALMLDAGIPLTRSFNTLAQQTSNNIFRKALQEMEESVKQGRSFAEALREHPRIFGDFYASMVAVAENSGTLSEVLRLLADQLKKEYDLRSRIRGALMYPAVIMVAMLLIGILLMIFVVPTFEQVFKDVNVELPPTTRLIFFLGSFLSRFWWAFLAILPFAIFGIRIFLQSTVGRGSIDWLMLRIPGLGTLSKEVYMAQFARSLSSLIKGGVGITEALQKTSDTLGNHYYKDSLSDAQKMIIKGETLHETLSGYSFLYPPLLIQMIAVGEETGKLSEMLERLASFYEEEVASATQNLSSLIEPVLMIVIGVVVGFFAVSILQPMYTFIGKI